jgi:putative colanic acid biosynthesis glycosyltransferase
MIGTAPEASGTDRKSPCGNSASAVGSAAGARDNYRKARSTPRISVITVVRNGEPSIAATIESVAGQRDASYEYIVVDGASSDGTIRILHDHRCRIDRLISEPDRGVYDAMIKGASVARGEWVIFLGAGDRFADERVLAEFDPRPDSDMAYGSCYWELPDRRRHVRTQPLEMLWRGNCFSHQAFFCRRRLLLELGFSPRLAIVADYEFYVRALALGYRIEDLGRPIAIVQAGGMSDQHFYRRTIERLTVVYKAFPEEPVLRYYGGRILRRMYQDLRKPVRRAFGRGRTG